MNLFSEGVEIFETFKLMQDRCAEDARREVFIGDFARGRSDAYRCAVHVMNQHPRSTRAIIAGIEAIRDELTRKSKEAGFLSYRFRLNGAIEFKMLTGADIPSPQSKGFYYPHRRTHGMLEAFAGILDILRVHLEREQDARALA